MNTPTRWHAVGGDERSDVDKQERARRLVELARRAAANLPLFESEGVAGRVFMGAPSCPKCGAPMQGGAPYGAPHGPWPVQWECPRCGYILVPATTSAAKGGAA